MIQNIDQALRIIKSTMHLHTDSTYFPYFFIVGAGISVPEIPSASEIIDICKKTVKEIDEDLFLQYEKESKNFADNGMKYYSKWIEYAYPNRINRSQLFKTLCSKSKISSANLMLAQILNSRQFANTVFTPNFDNSIEKALDLIGTENYFCAENTMDNLVISNQTKDIQVIHVHGTFNFYDCANLEKEIDNIASQSGTISSSRLLSSFLSNQAPIIVGYSGWENDVIMQCLKERLTYPTPLQYIWICYDKVSFLRLPKWIKDNDSVIFVIPDSDKNCEESCATDSWSETDNVTTIDATMFFKRIISDNKLEPPIIFTDPHKYYSQKIKSILPQNEDVFHLHNWTQRLKLLESDDAFEKSLQRLETAYISKDYAQASDIILEMSSQQLSEANAKFICSCLIRDFIRDEDAVTSFEQRLDFHLSSLKFIKNNLHQLSNTQNLIETMRGIVFTRCRYSDKEKMLVLFDAAIELANSDNRLLLIELTALAIKSDFVKKECRILILRDIISRCPDINNNNNNKSFAYLKFKALCELATTIFSSESISLLKEAEQILSIIEDDTLIMSICLKKSELLSKVNDQSTKEMWIKDIFNFLIKPVKKNEINKFIEIISFLSFLDADFLKLYSEKYNIESTLIDLLSHYEVDNSECHSLLQYSQCCEVLCNISDNSKIVEAFCHKIFETIVYFPHECYAFLDVLFNATCKYLSLSKDVVKDLEKIKIIKDIKGNKYTSRIYWDILEYVFNCKLFSDYSDFNEDIEYIHERKEKLSIGYKMYCSGDIQEAEQIFDELINCNIPSISNTALTNLAFMIRRNETTAKNNFEEIMQKKNILNGFDYMNLMLFYSSNNQLENEKYHKAKIELKNLSENEKNRIIKWWSNTDIVGEEESKLALSILKSLNIQPYYAINSISN